MSWTRSALVLLGVILSTSGCRMCAHPFDYCSPVVEGGRGTCGPRAGSILSSECGPGCVDGADDEGAPLPEGLSAQEGADEDILAAGHDTDVPPLGTKEGTVRVLSVSDRALKVPSAADVDDEDSTEPSAVADVEKMDDPAVPAGPSRRLAGKWTPAKRSVRTLRPGPVDDL